MNSALPLSVVVVARDAAGTLDVALSAILASDMVRESYELIVVDDASTDASPTVAARYADTVVRLTGRPSGPAYSRNRGAELARGEVIAFVDADTKVSPATLRAALSLFSERPGLDAIAASRSDASAAGNFASQYWNLLVRLGEERHTPIEGGFTSGCAAIRRTALFAVGMYDEWRFTTASLESVELGKRLTAAGYRVLLSEDLQITPLKRWSLGSVLREVWDRSSLLARSLGYHATRVLAPSEVVFTLSSVATPVFALVTVFLLSAFFTKPSTPMALVIAAAGLLLSNISVYRFFMRRRGLLFAIAAAPVHIVMQCAGAVGLCVGRLMRAAVGDRLPDAATQAYAEVGLETWPPVRRAK